jgi:hypothetical protein
MDSLQKVCLYTLYRHYLYCIYNLGTEDCIMQSLSCFFYLNNRRKNSYMFGVKFSHSFGKNNTIFLNTAVLYIE